MSYELEAKLTLHVGPVGAGTGGSNPISIPPSNLLEYELVWLRKDIEYTLGVVPGILVGRRIEFGATYASFGGGVVIDANGVGVGIYSALGVDLCLRSWCGNIELKRALGVTRSAVIAPYALRVGVTLNRW